MRILGIDTGIVNIGLAVIEDTHIIHCVCQNSEHNFDAYQKKFSNYINTHKPNHVVFEKPFFHPKRMGIIAEMYEIIGVQKVILHRKKIPYSFISPTDMKSGLTKVGTATKTDVHDVIKNTFGYDTDNTHINDALGLAYVHQQRTRLSNNK